MIAMDLATFANVCQVLAVLVFPAIFYAWRKIKAEISPNHGSSMRDAIDRIEKRQKKDRKEHRAEIAELRHLFTEHLNEFE